MHILIEMFLRFFSCGLFAVGGGLATLPFLYSISEQTGWYTYDDISNMIAISESTPGPLGVNMATYVGYQTEGFLGALVAPLSLVFPSVIIIILVSKVLDKFKTAPLVQHALYGLRAASAALIAAAGLGVAKIALLHLDMASEGVLQIFHWKAILLAIAIYIGLKKFPKHPIFYIVISAVIGVIFRF
ncbi:MAG: chromate transporter [Clostridium sp.]|nr:chromate transporter [Clostridium sp.]